VPHAESVEQSPLALAREGAHPVLAAQSVAQLADVEGEVVALGAEALSLPADASGLWRSLCYFRSRESGTSPHRMLR
jgi:hypothetical protein